uniref:Uncharacterized protein n=1 Tax=Anguilla anguilla TaxID=7936 RepID=A0A0E9R364_ANGAN
MNGSFLTHSPSIFTVFKYFAVEEPLDALGFYWAWLVL